MLHLGSIPGDVLRQILAVSRVPRPSCRAGRDQVCQYGTGISAEIFAELFSLSDRELAAGGADAAFADIGAVTAAVSAFVDGVACSGATVDRSVVAGLGWISGADCGGLPRSAARLPVDACSPSCVGPTK